MDINKVFILIPLKILIFKCTWHQTLHYPPSLMVQSYQSLLFENFRTYPTVSISSVFLPQPPILTSILVYFNIQANDPCNLWAFHSVPCLVYFLKLISTIHSRAKLRTAITNNFTFAKSKFQVYCSLILTFSLLAYSHW